jgi:hypothetical protein
MNKRILILLFLSIFIFGLLIFVSFYYKPLLYGIGLSIASQQEYERKYQIYRDDTLINISKGLSFSTTTGKLLLKTNGKKYLILKYSDANTSLSIEAYAIHGFIDIYSSNDIKTWFTKDSIPGYSIKFIQEEYSKYKDKNLIRIY